MAVKIYNFNWSYQLLEGHIKWPSIDGGMVGLAARAEKSGLTKEVPKRSQQLLVLSWLVGTEVKTLARK